jgi:signal transduction histidine kinase
VDAREPRPTFGLLFGSVSRMEADLREAERASQRSQEDVQHLRSYIGDASHDLRHPLSVIKIRLPMLLMSTNEVQQKRNYHIIRQETDRLENMIEDLLLLSRLDELDELSSEPTDLNRVAQAAADEVRSLVAARRQSLEVRLAESLPTAPLNASDVRRAITNLIENAIRYTPDGGSIQIETRADRADVVLQVSDTGCGIADDDLPHIFERFYRSQQSAQAHESGTGLGLAIVKKVVDKHNGQIEASSVLDEGTTFVVRFPTNEG